MEQDFGSVMLAPDSKSDPLWSIKNNLHQGMQPRLMNEEVRRIEDGVYFAKYAIAGLSW